MPRIDAQCRYCRTDYELDSKELLSSECANCGGAPLKKVYKRAPGIAFRGDGWAGRSSR
jgi:predicted nucleic acid-binding Zn ribbon protein